MRNVNLIIMPTSFLADEKRNCPLGVLYVAGAIERAGHHVQMVDLRGVDETQWLEQIPEAEFHGISASSLEYPQAVKLGRLLRARGDGRTILGGVHATCSEEAFSSFDMVVKGQGEAEALQAIGDTEGYTRFKKLEGNLDAYPWPARHLLPWDSVVSTTLVERGQPATTIIASRGCPFHCAFCATPSLYDKVRFRDPNLVVTEIEVLKAQGIAQFRFQDDVLTLNRNWLRTFENALAPLKIKFRANTRVDLLDEEKVQLLLDAGCIDIDLGIESVYQPTLNLTNKGQTVEQAKAAIALCKRGGLKTRINLVLGLPGDFGDLSSRTIAFLKETEPDGVDVNSLIPFPGSDLYHSPDRYGLRFRKNYRLENLLMTSGLRPGELDQDFTFEYDKMSNEELKYHRTKITEFVYQKGWNVNA